MKILKRKTLAALLALSLLASFLPLGAQPVLAAENVPATLLVGGTDVKSGGYWTTDADGKLTGITFPNQVTEPNHTSTDKATIDANGQILKIEEEYSYKSGSWEDDPNYNGEEYSTYSYFATEYTWENGQVTTAHVTDKYENTVNGETSSGEWHETNRYAYGDGKVTFSTYDGDGQTPNSTTVIEEQGNMRKVHHRQYGGGSYTEDEYVARYVQTEDISFVRPNLAADVEGMTADSTIVISVPGRVVCAYEGEYNSGFGYLSSDDYYSSLLDADNTAYYANTISGSTYFTVEHDGGETVCRDILGRPIYILTDGPLSSEGLRLFFHEPRSVIILARTSELGGVTTISSSSFTSIFSCTDL